MVIKTKVPIFRGIFTVCINKDLPESAREVKYDVDVSEYNAIAFEGRFRGSYQFVMLLGADADSGTITHESAHIARMMLDFIGHKSGDANDEVFCYLLEWVFRAAENCVLKYKAKYGKS